MHDAWSYGLAVITIILLIVAAVWIAYYDNNNPIPPKRVRFAEEPEVQGPPYGGFGAL